MPTRIKSVRLWHVLKRIWGSETMGDDREVISPVKTSDGKWCALGKKFRRLGQCQKYIWSKGFADGTPVDESWIYD